MQSVPLLSLLAAAVLTGSAVSAPAELLWPMPVASSCTGAPLPLGRQFSIAASSAVTPLLQRTIDRYIALIPVGPAAPATGGLDVLLVGVTGAGDGDPALSKDTDYSYVITVTAVNGTAGPMASYTRPPGSTTIHHRATITAGSVYGVMAGLESFSQLAGQAATLPCSRVSLTDRPAFRHRGLMLDTGRRHFPVALLKIILEGEGPRGSPLGDSDIQSPPSRVRPLLRCCFGVPHVTHPSPPAPAPPPPSTTGKLPRIWPTQEWPRPS